MSTAEVFAQVGRLLLILGPRWQMAAEPSILIRPCWATVQIDPGSASLVDRMALVDAAARVLGADAVPERDEDFDAAVWGSYTTATTADGVGRINGVPIVVLALILDSEMHPERVHP